MNSLSKNFDNFNHLINKLKLEFDILGISESRILKSQSLNTYVSLQNYVIEQTPTESTAGGALLYTNKKHSYKTRPDLAIYKPKKLESIFVEAVLLMKSNLIVGCIYKHPCMDICTFNDHYLSPLLDNLSKETNKTVVLLGDFNNDLLNFDTSEYVSTFLYDLASNSLQPQILLPTRISNNSKTLIDNVFCNIPNTLVKSAMSGNISSSISDHLPQFFIQPEFFSKSPPTKYNIISHDWEKFNNQSFLQDFEKINWNQALQLHQNNVNITFENYLNTANTLIKSHALFKKLNKKQRKFQQNHGLLNEFKMQLKRKIGSLKSTSNVMIVIKIFFMENIKHIEKAYQLY